jgi:hypothetical protein
VYLIKVQDQSGEAWADFVVLSKVIMVAAENAANLPVLTSASFLLIFFLLSKGKMLLICGFFS